MIKVIKSPITKIELEEIAKGGFGDLVKAVVDINQKILALDGKLHTDEESLFLERRSKGKDLWGINLYPDKPESEWIEFDSIINLKPSQGNRSRGVENEEIRMKIKKIVEKLII